MSTLRLLLRSNSLKTPRFVLPQHAAASGMKPITKLAVVASKINIEKVEIVLYLNFTTILACPIKTASHSLKPKLFSLI